jgi:PIN domain nuclease of toxin-antitoxin system
MNRLLLDSCSFYWWDQGIEITDMARQAIEQAGEVLVSAASAWEIMTKWRSGKAPEFGQLANSFIQVTEAHGFIQLAISVEHALQAASLPMHHRDPFDRMLIAQGLIEGLPIVTPASIFDRYGTKRVW